MLCDNLAKLLPSLVTLGDNLPYPPPFQKCFVVFEGYQHLLCAYSLFFRNVMAKEAACKMLVKLSIASYLNQQSQSDKVPLGIHVRGLYIIIL